MVSPLVAELLPIALLLSLGIVFTLAYLRIERGGSAPPLRPLADLPSLRALTEQAVEEGRTLHLALGTGRLSEASAAETLMGIVLLDELVEQGVPFDRGPLVTTGDASSQLLAADNLQRVGPERGDKARFLAPQSAAYAAAARGLIQREPLPHTLVAGHLGDEYLFLAADVPNGGEPQPAPLVAATARLETLPFLPLTARQALLGEELFALGAYLGRWPGHLAGVLLQDVARVLLVLAILTGVLLRSLGLF